MTETKDEYREFLVRMADKTLAAICGLEIDSREHDVARAVYLTYADALAVYDTIHTAPKDTTESA